MSAKLSKERPDLCENFAETGVRPQNLLLDAEDGERFREHPKLQELLRLKASLVKARSHPEQFLKADIRTLNPATLGKFDVILVDPPWPEYFKRVAMLDLPTTCEKLENWSMEEMRRIPLADLAATPAFVFLWAGSEHLDHARHLFRNWGVKRCEDIVWLKSRMQPDTLPSYADKHSLLKRVKEHCLVGIVGDSKQASDQTFIHPNIDTDVILQEEPEIGNLNKPHELSEIIERFCLGRRRLELFANNASIRPGWVCVGKYLREGGFDRETYDKWFEGEPQPNSYVGGRLLQTTEAIEALRPKSPPRA